MSSEPYTVKTLLQHDQVVVRHIHLAPGHETPRHRHGHDYVVRPHQDTTLTKTTYKDGKVLREETVEHKAHVAYVVPKSEDGTEFVIKNTGSVAMMCDKTLLPPKS